MKMMRDLMHQKSELQIASLIDAVFLLLVYFMATSSQLWMPAPLRA
ncbi:MAG: biopolymer transporter ExbD [Kiritimatiellaceae bacterium]|nr:biopolymer transporter ExbD [Kiritimatiellaceae bacterium]